MGRTGNEAITNQVITFQTNKQLANKVWGGVREIKFKAHLVTFLLVQENGYVYLGNDCSPFAIVIKTNLSHRISVGICHGNLAVSILSTST